MNSAPLTSHEITWEPEVSHPLVLVGAVTCSAEAQSATSGRERRAWASIAVGGWVIWRGGRERERERGSEGI